ncbi:MAG: division/cell wall cluster transcriptional repressor MraZ [Candidatus Pacebacteria bacterium]|nr:division/cell wall cluster transcriptional repressor MraZ [Candidatus Paceibacterota bacterium]
MENCGENSTNLWKMFIGEYTYNLDSKRRLAIPAKFRKLLGKKAVITRGLDNCLFLFPEKEWKKLAEKISKLPLSQADARGFARIMLAGATDVEIDSLGRILIPEYLKKYAQLTKKVVIAGIANRIEIWDEKVWRKYQERTEKEAGDIAERLKELGV